MPTRKKPQVSNADQQIEELAQFIMTEVNGEPSQNESAVSCAIRLLRDRRMDERTVVLNRTGRQAGASYFEFRSSELILRATLACPDDWETIEVSWPRPAALPF